MRRPAYLSSPSTDATVFLTPIRAGDFRRCGARWHAVRHPDSFMKKDKIIIPSR